MSLKGKTVLFFAGPLYEDLELWYPKIRLEEEGAATTVAGLGERTYAGKRGYPVTVDTNVTDVDAGDFDGLVIPGGFAPDQLRRHDVVLKITREILRTTSWRRSWSGANPPGMTRPSKSPASTSVTFVSTVTG